MGLANQDRPFVLEHLFAALVVAGGAEFDDAAIGPRGVALGEHQRLRCDRVAGINRLVPFHFFVAEMRDRALAQILDRKSDHHVHHQHVIDDHPLEAERLRILAIKVARVEVHGDAGEKTVVALGDGPTPMMLKKMADLEVLEVVPTLDFAHRHNGSGCLASCDRRVAKSPEAEPVFYGIRGCTSILLLRCRGYPCQGSMKPRRVSLKSRQPLPKAHPGSIVKSWPTRQLTLASN